MKRGILPLLLLFASITFVLLLKVWAEPNGFITPDSYSYLGAADNLAIGNGLIAPNPDSDFAGQKMYLSIWPAGYSITIAGLMWCTGLSSLWASKIVNLIFLGFIFILLYKWVGEFAWFPALYFCSFSMLEIYAYTWSEAPFLFFVMYLCYVIYCDVQTEKRDRLLVAKLIFILISLFLFRYAGLIYFFVVLGLMLYWLKEKKWYRVAHYFTALLLSSIFVLLYFYNNKLITGYYTGVDRIRPAQESVLYFGQLFLQGFCNELTLARNYFFNGRPDFLYVILLALQFIVIAVMVIYKRSMNVVFGKLDNIMKVLFSVGLFYLIALVVLRKIQPFDPFDYRVMAPFSLPIYIGLMIRLTREELVDYYKKTRPWVTSFMLLSLLMNLPKAFIWQILKQWF